MADQEELRIVITAKDEATKVLNALSGSAKKTSGALGDTSKSADKGGLSIGKLAAAVGLGNLAYNAFHKAVGFVTSTLKSSITEFGVQEQAIARLRAGLKNTTPEWKKGTDELVRYASQLQKVTTFGDEQIISAQGMLSTFMLNDKQIKQLTPSILDMAAALEKTGGSEADLQQISILLGKAIGGEDVAGLAGALRRVGVVMTEAQTEILKTGTMQERLGAITTIVSQNFGGFAAETANTYTGKMRQMQNAVSDVREAIGERLAPVIGAIAQHITAFVSGDKLVGWLDAVSNTISQKIVPFIREYFVPAWKDAYEAIKPHVPILKEVAKYLGIFAGSVIVGGLIVLNEVLTAGIELFAKMIQLVKDLIAQLQRIPNAASGIWGDIKGGAGGFFNLLSSGKLEGRAGGGSVRAGQLYQVNEQGGEGFIPDVSGRVIKNGDMNATTNLTVNVGSVRGQSDIDAIVDAVSRVLNRRSDLAAKGAF